MPRRLASFLLVSLPLLAQVTPQEAGLLKSVDANMRATVQTLERLVNVNSGTFNPAGVRSVVEMVDAEFRALGFTTKIIPGDSRGRGPHFFAEHKPASPSAGKPLLLIGHTDTVFEPASPFQKFAADGKGWAKGPGVSDMKGGLVIMLSALKALQQNGLLENAAINVYLTGDEEAPGEPLSAARAGLIEAGKNSKAAMCFEGGSHIDGQDYLSTARRGAVAWELRVKGTAGHSSGIFTERMGHGAIYEISRILSQFHDQLQEPNLTFSVGLIVGGEDVKADGNGAASVHGKPNIIAGEALARGDVRALTPEQVSRVKDRMYGIVAKSLPGTSAKLTFVDDEYPPMAPSAGNKRMLATLNAACRRAGIPEAAELDPMKRGAGDSSFIAPYTDCITGFGAIGAGAHAPGESVDLESLPRLIKRAAFTMYTLTR